MNNTVIYITHNYRAIIMSMSNAFQKYLSLRTGSYIDVKVAEDELKNGIRLGFLASRLYDYKDGEIIELDEEDYVLYQWALRNGEAMIDRAKTELAQRLAKMDGIPIESAEDTVEETQRQITEFLNGNSRYNSVAQILADYLHAPSEYSWIFLYDADRAL